MIGRCIALGLMMAAIPASVAAEHPSPEIPETAFRDIDFVPADWKLYDKVQGDLNGDGQTDSVLVIQGTDPALQMDNPDGFGVDYHDANPRILLVVVSDGEGRLRLVGRDNDLIPAWDSPIIDDPLEMIDIGGGGKLTVWIHFWASAGSWTMFNKQFHFRWDGDQMDLIGYDSIEIHRASLDSKGVSVNYLTGRRKDVVGNEDRGESKASWSTVDLAAKPQLGSIGNGFEFEP